MLVLSKSRYGRLTQVPYSIFHRQRLLVQWFRVFEICNSRIFPKPNIKDALSYLRDMKIICIQKFVLNKITCCIKQFEDICHRIFISIRKHSRDIFRNEKKRLRFLKYTDVVVKQLASRIIYSAQRTSLRPRLARRTTNYPDNILRKIFF